MILGIETSTEVCGAALVEGGLVMGEESVRSRAVHSERLMPMVERLLTGAGLDLGDLDGVAVSAGPGSFTGLRIGMATAKGLCVASEKPLVAVSTLEAIALPACVPDRPLCALMHARQEEVFAAVYRGGVVIEPQAVELAELVERLPRPVHFAGPGIRHHQKVLAAMLGGDATFAPDPLNDPCADAVALLGERLLAEGRTVDPVHAEPAYLKVSQVEKPRT